MSFAISCHTFGEYVDLFDKLQYLIQDKSLIDLRKRKKNSNEPILVSIDWESTLGTGDTLAIFQAAGKVFFEIKMLIICCSQAAM